MVNGKAEIDLKAANQVLDKVGNRPIAIITVAGIKRIGKSFLLGYFYVTYVIMEKEIGLKVSYQNNLNGEVDQNELLLVYFGGQSHFMSILMVSKRPYY